MTTEEHIRRLDPEIAWRAWWLVYIARSIGIPLIITSSVRSAEEQRRLFQAGYSRTERSKHLVARAFDVDVKGYSRDDVPLHIWNWLATVGDYLGLYWGGRFKNFFDAGHFELR